MSSFAQIFFWQKELQSQTVIREKLYRTFLYEKNCLENVGEIYTFSTLSTQNVVVNIRRRMLLVSTDHRCILMNFILFFMATEQPLKSTF